MYRLFTEFGGLLYRSRCIALLLCLLETCMYSCAALPTLEHAVYTCPGENVSR